MGVTVNWGAIGIVSVIAFLIGWWILGLFWAIILAIVVMVLMGIIQIR